MKRTVTAIALIALLLAAAPAAAKPKAYHYEGETEAGQSIEFTLTGKRISAIDGLVSTTCVPTHGVPLTFSYEFSPPGSFVLGKTRKASDTEYMAYKGDVTKYYTVKLKRIKGKNHWQADLSVNFSYEEVNFGYGSEIVQRFYICQGNDSFTFVTP